MTLTRILNRLAPASVALALLTGCAQTPAAAPKAPAGQASAKPADALPSWNDGATKQAILSFVAKTTTAGSPDFVPPEQRMATFDNDDTL